jgi:diphthamide synthase (EF-2-diphthine--ammonia ligase)
MKRTLLSWSSGKDSAWSLQLLRQQNEYEIVGLLTTFNQAANRVAMHAVVGASWKLSEAVRHSSVGSGFAVAVLKCRLRVHHEEKCKNAVRAGIECIAFGDPS